MANPLDLQGTFTQLPTLVEFKFHDGTSVVVPEGTAVDKTFTRTIGDIIDIVCKLVGCGGRGGGSTQNPGCYTIISPDGTKITICPPGKIA